MKSLRHCCYVSLFPYLVGKAYWLQVLSHQKSLVMLKVIFWNKPQLRQLDLHFCICPSEREVVSVISVLFMIANEDGKRVRDFMPDCNHSCD